MPDPCGTDDISRYDIYINFFCRPSWTSRAARVAFPIDAIPTDSSLHPQLPVPPTMPTNPTSPATPLGATQHNAKIVSSTGSNVDPRRHRPPATSSRSLPYTVSSNNGLPLSSLAQSTRSLNCACRSFPPLDSLDPIPSSRRRRAPCYPDTNELDIPISHPLPTTGDASFPSS